MHWRSLIVACTLLSAALLCVDAKPHGYGQLTERQQDEFAAMLGEVFPETQHHIRHATRRHWRNKMKPHSHIHMLENSVPLDDERTAVTDSPPAQ